MRAERRRSGARAHLERKQQQELAHPIAELVESLALCSRIVGRSAGTRLGAAKNSAYNLYEAAQYTMRSNSQKTYQQLKPKTVR